MHAELGSDAAVGLRMDNTIALVTDASCMDFPTSDAAVRRNEWNHIAIVVTPSSKHVDFFINGTAAGSHTGDFTIEDGDPDGDLHWWNSGMSAYLSHLHDVQRLDG